MRVGHNSNTQLNLIDSFLKNENGKKAVKKAIDVVKPFFFHMVNEKIEEQSSTLLSGLRFHENKYEALSHYLLVKKYPELLESRVLSEVVNYNSHRENLEFNDRQKPEESRRFKFR